MRLGGDYGGMWRRTVSAWVWICGGAVLLAALLVRLSTGSPYPVLHTVRVDLVLPPTWITGLIWLAGFFAVGCGWGYVLGLRGCSARRQALKFQGGMYIVLSVTLALAWYPLLFGLTSFLISWLCLLGAAGMALLCAWAWIRLSRGAAALVLAFALWLLYLSFVQLGVILHI